ncbi:hypothetical protein [Arenibaculum sp.]|nr:hypothetical protein [Arenibaculum sp.]
MAAVYNRRAYLDERRKALQDWADHVERLVAGDAGRTRGGDRDAQERPAA